jgi:hypothetical protein
MRSISPGGLTAVFDMYLAFPMDCPIPIGIGPASEAHPAGLVDILI